MHVTLFVCDYLISAYILLLYKVEGHELSQTRPMSMPMPISFISV